MSKPLHQIFVAFSEKLNFTYILFSLIELPIQMVCSRLFCYKIGVFHYFQCFKARILSRNNASMSKKGQQKLSGPFSAPYITHYAQNKKLWPAHFYSKRMRLNLMPSFFKRCQIPSLSNLLAQTLHSLIKFKNKHLTKI